MTNPWRSCSQQRRIGWRAHIYPCIESQRILWRKLKILRHHLSYSDVVVCASD